MEKELCVAESFWENGKIKKKEILVAGDNLIERHYNSDGEIWKEVNYDNDYEKHGDFILFYFSGTVKLQETYIHRVIQRQITYDQDGQILTEDDFIDGRLKRRVVRRVGEIEF